MILVVGKDNSAVVAAIDRVIDQALIDSTR